MGIWVAHSGLVLTPVRADQWIILGSGWSPVLGQDGHTLPAARGTVAEGLGPPRFASNQPVWFSVARFSGAEFEVKSRFHQHFEDTGHGLLVPFGGCSSTIIVLLFL